MREMRYEAPHSLQAALALLATDDGPVRIMAGGTDLLLQMRAGRIDPALLVDVKSIPEMTAITTDGKCFRIGAAVACMDLMDHAALTHAWPGVVDGIKLIGSIQVKGRATMGGNLCNASPAADGVTALLAAGATATIAGPGGQRELPVEDAAIGPGKTSLAPDEFIVSFTLPARPPRAADAYLRFTPRTEMDIAVVGAAVNLTLDASGVCIDARVSLGAVAERALLVPEAAATLVGTTLDAAALARLGAAASAACRPIDDKRGTREFRIQIANVLARRAAQLAHARAKERN